MRGEVHILVYCPIDTLQWGQTHSAMVMMMMVMPMAMAIGYGVVDGDNDNKMQVEAGLRNSAQHVTEETSKVPIARCHKYERYICAIPQI